MRRGLWLAWGSMLATVATALVVFWLAYDDATFGLVARSSLAIAIWWVIGIGVALGVLRPPSSRAFWGVAGLLAAFGAWTGASMAWAASDERAFNEMNRVVMYLGVFLLAGMLTRHAALSRWADGVAVGIVGVVALALGQRFYPDAFPRGELSRYSTGPQLSYPVEYVNGLGIFAALALPLLLRAAVGSRLPLVRGVAVAPFPAIAALMYLTSSRGAVIVAATGIVTFLLLTPSRWATAGALAIAAAGSAGAIAVLVNRPELVDQPLTQAAEDQGGEAALLIAFLCIAAGLAYGAGARVLRGWDPPRAIGWATVAATCVLLVAGIAAADPVEKLDTFRKPPTAAGVTTPQYTVRGHLLSANSTGRWQFWKAAGKQFEAHPLVGDGAGSYEAWWARHGSFPMFITDAHSLYLEALGELGVIGFLLLLGALGLGAVAAARRALSLTGPARSGIAGLAACFIAYATSTALDWMWELTVVSVVGFGALGWALGNGAGSGPRTVASRIVLPVVAVLAIFAQFIPLTSTLAIRDSQAAVEDGALANALDDARAARDVQPWAASPHLQLALVLEEDGQLRAARTAIGDAIERDRNDWRLWLVRARLETKARAIRAARRSVRRAAALNPRSPLFSRG